MNTDSTFEKELASLIAKVSTVATGTGVDTCKSMQVAVDPILDWIGYIGQSRLTGTADHFIAGLHSLMLESVCAASVGLYRSCLLSQRGQIDVALSWLFFKDHPVEWQRVLRENEGYRLKKDVFAYLVDYHPNFRSRFGILLEAKARTEAEPYRVLSAHLHSIGLNTVPAVKKFSDIVWEEVASTDCVVIQAGVAEYIEDIFLSVFGSEWASLPSPIIERVSSRLDAEKSAKIFG